MNGQKSWLIVKNEQSAERARILFGETVNVTTEGKRHLGAVLGSLAYKESYCNGMVDSWIDQLKVLSEFAVSQPQAAYAVFTKGFRSKFTFFFRSISGFEDFISPLDSFVTEKFLPIIWLTGSLPTRRKQGYFRPRTPRGWTWLAISLC